MIGKLQESQYIKAKRKSRGKEAQQNQKVLEK